MKRYPQLDIEVKIDNTVHICELLQSNKIDVGLVEGETGDKKFHKEEFYIDRLVLIGPIGSPKKMQRRDLETVTWITREQGSGTRVQWEEFLEKNSVLPAKTIIFNTNFAVKEAVRNDLGYALLSEHIAKQAAAAGEVWRIENHKGFREGSGRRCGMMTTLTITLPHTPRCLSPNAKAPLTQRGAIEAGYKKTAAKSRARNIAWGRTCEALNGRSDDRIHRRSHF